MKDIDAFEAAYRNGLEDGAKYYKEQRDLLLQENAELFGKVEQLEEAVGRMAIELAAVKKERDAAVACIEALKDDFVDYVCSGTSNTNPYCANKTDDCTDKRGWCVYVKNCRGFKPKAYEEWSGIDEN